MRICGVISSNVANEGTNHIFLKNNNNEKKNCVQKVLTVKSNHDAACLRCDLRAPSEVGGSIRWRRLPAIMLRVIISTVYGVSDVYICGYTDAE